MVLRKSVQIPNITEYRIGADATNTSMLTQNESWFEEEVPHDDSWFAEEVLGSHEQMSPHGYTVAAIGLFLIAAFGTFNNLLVLIVFAKHKQVRKNNLLVKHK